MIGSALCLVLNSCIMLLYDTFFFLSQKGRSGRGNTNSHSLV